MMPRHFPVRALVLPVLCLALAGCSTPSSPHAGARAARFHEASRADAVLQFSSWDYTFLVQPRYDENGFLQQVPRDGMNRVFEQMNVRREMAVVVVGWGYNHQELSRLVADWKSILGGCGFRRVVFLRSNASNKLNGSLIIDDSNLSFASAETPGPLGQTSPR
jgi:hypothetical protein